MTMHNLDLFSYYDIAEYWKEGKHGRHCRFSVNHKERDMIDLEAICKVSNPSSTLISMSYDNHFMSTVDKLGR